MVNVRHIVCNRTDESVLKDTLKDVYNLLLTLHCWS